MKSNFAVRNANVFVFLLVFLLSGNVFTQNFKVISQGFEGGALPSGWIKEFVSGTTDWIFVNGGHNSHPAAAHTGNFNAMFYVENYTYPVTRLVTPKLNLSLYGSAKLKFWHTQEKWLSDQDTLKLSYKVGINGTWNVLQTFSGNIAAWQPDSFNLPQLVDSVYIGFIGIGSYGYGICLDDVSVEVTPPCTDVFQGELNFSGVLQTAAYSAGTMPYWKFYAVAGTGYKFSMCTNSEDSYIAVFDSTFANLINFDDDGWNCTGYAASGLWVCPVTGNYYIRASHWGCSGLNNSGNLEYFIASPRLCDQCGPANTIITQFPMEYAQGYYTMGALDDGKWTVLFYGRKDKVYHFDLCPSAPGDGYANFNVDIKITDSLCNIITGIDGSCGVPNAYRPNDYTWTCRADGYYHVVLAPFSSFNSHNCSGDSNDSITMFYYQEPPVLVCPPGSTMENEPLCGPGYIDVTNGGCNSTPNVFTEITNTCFQVFCGKSGTFDGSSRDTDWYRLVLSSPRIIQWRAVAEFPLSLHIIDGNSGCPGTTLKYISGDAGDTISVIDTVTAGTYYLWVGPSIFGGVPCGSDYIAAFTSIIPSPPAPHPHINPNCMITILDPMTPPSGTTYYWQGTSCATNTSSPATSSYPVSQSGTYFVRAMHAGCWSDCNSTRVYIANPPSNITSTASNPSICLGDSSTLRGTASGCSNILYRWRNGGNILRDWNDSSRYIVHPTVTTTYTLDAGCYFKRVLVLFADVDDHGLASYFASDSRFSFVETYNAHDSTPSQAFLNQFNTIITWSNYPYMNTDTLGNRMKKYIDNGGGLVMMTFSHLSDMYGLRGAFMAGNYDPVKPALNCGYTNDSIGVVSNPSHPVMSGVSDVKPSYHAYTDTLTNGSSPLFYWTDGTIGAAVKTIGNSRIVALNQFPGMDYGAHANKLIANSAFWVLKKGTIFGACTGPSNVVVAVTRVPGSAGTISGTTPVCQGQSTVSYTVPGISDATTYIWQYTGSHSTISGNTYNCSINYAANATSGNLTVYGHNQCGNGTISASYPVVVNPLPDSARSITGTSNICTIRTGLAYSVPVINNSSSYEWSYSGTGATINGTGANITIDFAGNATNGILRVRGYNSLCGYGAYSPNFAIFISAMPDAAGTISGTSTVCQGATLTYSVPLITNANSYVWTYSGTGATISGASNSVSITFANNATAGILRVKGHNNCGDGTISAGFNIMMNPLPAPAGNITGTGSICAGQTGISYSVPMITDATGYTWAYSGTGATINGSSNSVTIDFSSGATSGSLTVRGLNGCGNGTVSAGFPVNVINTPPAAGNISGQAGVCRGNTGITYTVPVISGATSYIWTLPAGFIGTSTTNTINIDFNNTALSDTLFVQGSNQCGPGVSSFFVVTVTGLPASAGTITGTANVCWTDLGIAYSIPSVSDATSYQWNYSGAGATINGSGVSVTMDFPANSTSGDLTVRGQNNCGNGGSSTAFHITVSPCNYGINESTPGEGLTIIPNPNKGIFDIEFYSEGNTNCTVTIMNSLGQSLPSHDYIVVKGKNIYRTDLSKSSNGVYFIKMNTGNDILTKKIVINR